MARANESLRAFVAIELGERARRLLGELIGRLSGKGAKVAWVRPENLHLTVRFLGDVSPSQIEELSRELTSALGEINAFELTLSGVGAFPNVRRAAVVWAGVHAVPEALILVHRATENAARGIGVLEETKAFRPHVTLGRVRDRRGDHNLIEALEQESEFDGGAFPVRAVSLFSSRLTPNGARYQRIREFSLACTSTSE